MSPAAHDHGAALARDLGFTPIYLHYNTGRHVSVNGRAFAGLLEQLVAAWPARTDGLVPVDSALGIHARQELTLGFPEAHRWIAHGTSHLDLLSRPEVYAKLRSWLSS